MPLRSPSAFEHGLAEHDADVFDGVVLIHVEIARRLQRQIEAAVPREQLQHVIEEADAGRDRRTSRAVEDQLRRRSAFPWSADRTRARRSPPSSPCPRPFERREPHRHRFARAPSVPSACASVTTVSPMRRRPAARHALHGDLAHEVRAATGRRGRARRRRSAARDSSRSRSRRRPAPTTARRTASRRIAPARAIASSSTTRCSAATALASSIASSSDARRR